MNNKSIYFYRLALGNVQYQIHIAKDGNKQWCALLGNNTEDGISGYGDTISESLRALADNIELK